MSVSPALCRKRFIEDIKHYPEKICLYGPDGEPFHANQAALDHYGWRHHDEFTAENDFDTVHPEERDLIRELVADLAPRPLQMTYRARTAEGDYRPVIETCSPFTDRRGRLKGFVTHTHDAAAHSEVQLYIDRISQGFGN